MSDEITKANQKEEIPAVTVIILNWNCWEDTIECLESLYRVSYLNFEIIVVDNGSEDDSRTRIREYCRGELEPESEFSEYDFNCKPIELTTYTKEDLSSDVECNFPTAEPSLTLIENEENLGYTGGNNVGIRFALDAGDPEHLLLLNSDTVVDTEFLTELVAAAEKEENVGFVGPKIYFYAYGEKDRRNVIQYAGATHNLWRFQPRHFGMGEIDCGHYDEDTETEYVHGSCMLVRTAMIKEIGLLDDEFFSFREENDWAMRGWKHGWKSVYAPQSKIWHKGSGGPTEELSDRGLLNTYYMVRNRFLFVKKHANLHQMISFLAYFFLYEFWFTTQLYIRKRKSPQAYLEYVRGVIGGIRTFLPRDKSS